MKKAIIAYVLGAATVGLVVISCMCTGTPFKSMPMKYGIEQGRGIIFTKRFVIVYEDMEGNAAGGGGFTWAGKHGTIPAFWIGYGCGWYGGPAGIESLHTYEPGFGTATLFFHGKVLRVEEDGEFLRVQNQRFRLGDTRIVAVVGTDGLCHRVQGADADALLKGIPSWYKDPDPTARPVSLEKGQQALRADADKPRR